MKPELMMMTAVAVATALLSELLVRADPQYYSSQTYNYWSDPNVDMPKLFGVDQKIRRVVVAATNTMFHLSLDLKNVSNAQDVTPSDETLSHCKFEIFLPDEACHNFHHILYFLSGPGYITTIYGKVPKEETVLICGSNAHNPECVLRNRTNLEGLNRFEASGFCPSGEERGVIHVSKSEQTVAALALRSDPSYYAITLLTSPFSGDILLKTVRDDFLYFNDPRFIRFYENEDFYYLFMTEHPVESLDYETFSRVARVCKNDAGRSNVAQKVFVTYVKARLACRSTLFSNIGFDYNVLQDIVLVSNSSANAPISGEHLYGIFTGEINGPLGSALCFYTFDGLNKTLSGNFLVQSSANEWIEEENDPPLTCAEGRSLDLAEVNILMKDVARQEEGEPMFMMDATFFHKLLVDKVTALDQKEYEVVLIAASVHDVLQLLKVTYIPTREGSDKSFVIQSIPLNRNGSLGNSQNVGRMELYRTDDEVSVYLSTDEGLYVVPITNCNTYSECRSCVEARDPYCAFDTSKRSCISLLGNSDDSVKLQDVVNGESTGCEAHFSSHSISSSAALSPSPVTLSMDVGMSSRIELSVLSSRLTITTPESSMGPGAVASQPISSVDHVWTIVAAVGGLILGTVIGLLAFAAIRNREKLLFWHYLLHRS